MSPKAKAGVMSRPSDTRIATIAEWLLEAASGRDLSPKEPWDYGWCVEEYRSSENAAIAHDHSRSVRLQPDAVRAFEDATQRLLKMPIIRELYDAEAMWGIVASLVGTLPLEAPPGELARVVEARLSQLLNPPDSFVIFPVANVDPGVSPLEIGPLLLGRLDATWMERFSARAGLQEFERLSHTSWWVTPEAGEKSSGTSEPPVLLAHFGRAQLQRAVHQAEGLFQALADLALMLELDLDARSLYSLCGDSHRPGVRGLVIDRQSLQALAKTTPVVTHELGATILTSSLFGQTLHHQWYGEHPFPLAALLNTPERYNAARILLTGSSAVERRLRTAARWHAKAFWSSELEDAVLALGIAFDAMLSESNPSPGRVLAERFALLTPTPDARAEAYRLFLNGYYTARSAVAHGAKGSTVDAAFVRRMAADVRRIFSTILELTRRRGVATEDAYRELFEHLKWGTLSIHQDA
jgi:hypothetical protein